ncbi:hypothetical protein THAOC_28175 [Thalassiosira oceanica]|uniref:Uncharacterized protein n=1 Tax=Thalassiosira oceanica TaxID=159749 RepID=K0S0W8_THAOC|nr:hypothetical protein THAOC_28175 [Thalassiosira oceanica]|eukprot:EJK52537.1 hypothetical protein THAOC_28175 [Thalassiosira oceanica]
MKGGQTDMRERVYRPGRGPWHHNNGVGFGVSQAASTRTNCEIAGEYWGTAMVVEVATCVCGVPPLPMGHPSMGTTTDTSLWTLLGRLTLAILHAARKWKPSRRLIEESDNDQVSLP